MTTDAEIDSAFDAVIVAARAHLALLRAGDRATEQQRSLERTWRSTTPPCATTTCSARHTTRSPRGTSRYLEPEEGADTDVPEPALEGPRRPRSGASAIWRTASAATSRYRTSPPYSRWVANSGGGTGPYTTRSTRAHPGEQPRRRRLRAGSGRRRLARLARRYAELVPGNGVLMVNTVASPLRSVIQSSPRRTSRSACGRVTSCCTGSTRRSSTRSLRAGRGRRRGGSAVADPAPAGVFVVTEQSSMRAWQVHSTARRGTSSRLDEVPVPEPGAGRGVVGAAVGLNFPDLLLCRPVYQKRPALPFTPAWRSRVRWSRPARARAAVGDGSSAAADAAGGLAELAVLPRGVALPWPGRDAVGQGRRCSSPTRRRLRAAPSRGAEGEGDPAGARGRRRRRYGGGPAGSRPPAPR